MNDELVDAMADLAIDDVLAEVKKLQDQGAPPLEILRDLQEGMRLVGDEMLPLDRLTWVAPDTGIHQVIEQISADGQGFAGDLETQRRE